MGKIESYLGWKVDFAHPPGAAAFRAPDSVSWRVLITAALRPRRPENR